MVVYKCDACGKELETNEKLLYRMNIGIVNKLHNTVPSVIERDLCGECYDKIIYILKGTDENNNNKEE
ncbi:MAG: hypothetical protein J6U54_12655 [Clostridiales bacterium]|nr:hypothetical protein [Clostridiales bacterium]